MACLSLSKPSCLVYPSVPAIGIVSPAFKPIRASNTYLTEATLIETNPSSDKICKITKSSPVARLRAGVGGVWVGGEVACTFST